MKANENPKAAGSSKVMRMVEEGSPARRGLPFSDVLNALSKRDLKERNITDLLANADPKSVMSPINDSSAFDEPSAVAEPPSNIDTKRLISWLVDEIRTEAPPNAHSSVEIQFASRVLDGLHVRIQKTSKGVDVSLATASPAISKLLADNASVLAEALVQRGYIEPKLTVNEVQAMPFTSSSSSSRERRDSKREPRQGSKKDGRR